MQSIVVHQFGGSDKLLYEDILIPNPKSGEVRVKVSAIGLNYTDIYQRKGIYSNPLPLILGLEFAGTVDALGENVTDFQVGDRVGTANGKGGYAEYALVQASKLIHLPPNVSFNQAAALLLQGITAHYLATSTFQLSPDSTALIHAAAGGVGQLLVQIAKKRGAKVIATVSNQKKAEIAIQLGADEIINYSETDFASEVIKITNNAGVDVIYDGVGKTTFHNGLKCLKPRGLMVLYGQASGAVEPIDPQILNINGSLYLTRPTINHYILTRDELLQRANDLFAWMTSGELKITIDKIYDLENAKLAHEYMENRATQGKVLLVP